MSFAGSGSNLPLTHVLVEGFRGEPAHADDCPREHRLLRRHPRGARRGDRRRPDLSRPLSEEERRAGLVAFPYARVAVVVAANQSVPDLHHARAPGAPLRPAEGAVD